MAKTTKTKLLFYTILFSTLYLSVALSTMRVALAQTANYSFDDEFNGTTLDTSTWYTFDGGDSWGGSDCFHPANDTVSGGIMTITSRKENIACTGGGSYNYTSGQISWKSFGFTYGTVEFRAKLAGGQGTWPAVWLLGTKCQPTGGGSTCKWPATGSDEIDIAEIMSGNLTAVNQQIHSNGNNPGCTAQTSDVSKNWHTYDLIWAPGSLKWQIDGVTTCTETSSVPTTPMFMLIDTYMGSDSGTIVDSTLPQTTQIDYVRITPSGGSAPSSSDTQAPSVPANLTATANSQTQINLSWTASTDNVGVTGYNIYRNGTKIGTSATTTYNDTGLTASTAYNYTVSAYDAAGNQSAQTSQASATTSAVAKTYGISDFTALAADWLQTKQSAADANGDGTVDARDLGIMMHSWKN